MAFNRLVFRVHAIRRMFQRRINEKDVRHVLATGEVIEEYPNETPYPSRLVLGWCGPQPIHIAVADNIDAGETIVITVYEPSLDKWDSNFRRRKS